MKYVVLVSQPTPLGASVYAPGDVFYSTERAAQAALARLTEHWGDNACPADLCPSAEIMELVPGYAAAEAGSTIWLLRRQPREPTPIPRMGAYYASITAARNAMCMYLLQNAPPGLSLETAMKLAERGIVLAPQGRLDIYALHHAGVTFER